ncbi:MAG: dihydropteroate synthase [Verrucomicrobiota bacterium]
MIFRACNWSVEWSVEFPQPTIVMGILNVTPDSFSDGGQFLDPKQAVDHALEMRDHGAKIIDIGGESTRPGADPVPEAIELQRVIPVIESLRSANIPICIDTQKTAVARRALEAGAIIVNDNAAAHQGPEMAELIASTGAGYILMHMQGTPQTMAKNPHYENVVREVNDFFSERLNHLTQAGVAPEQVIFDPGIGFGKNASHNLQLLANLNHFTMHQRPVLVGASRKSVIGRLLGGEVTARLPGSLACAAWAALNGAQFIRAHDVAETVQLLRMIEEIQRHKQA